MGKRMKIVFGKPYHIPSSVHGVEVVFPYEIMSAPIEDKNEETKSFKLQVLIDPDLASILGFQFWQPSETYSGLLKLLLSDVIDEIKRKYYYGILNDFESIVLITSNYASERIHQINQLPEVEGYEELFFGS